MSANEESSRPTVAFAPYPAEGAGNQTYSNIYLVAAIVGIPFSITYAIGLGIWSFVILTLLLALPILGGSIYLGSHISSPWKNTVKLPNRNIEEYLDIKDPGLSHYKGRNKIPMETFFENYMSGKIDLKGDALEIFEQRYDWASFKLQPGQAKFFFFQWIPELIWHSKSQDEDQVRDHYDRGNDFYEAFLGPTMVYTAGIIGDPNNRETLEQLQENKMKLVCEKVQMKQGDRHLDIGCGWGTLTAYAAKNYGSDSTGVTLAKNQTQFGTKRCEEYGVSGSARIKCMDYRDIPRDQKFNKITCLEMAEHVGIRRFQEFLLEVKDILEDDGLFFMQIAGLRATWQYEDFIWGLFMAKYIFPGADASCPLYWVVRQLEMAGFEIKNVDTVGVHYSATIERWYRNWLNSRERITAKYGERWFRLWEVFLAWSTIISRQGSATCFQITAHKNRNGFDRSKLITKRLVG
ncbi:S-adenosyl-L-methionine-dependent methyltransferase [Basidiobolus meristosporus CBS 931.73]|uniref:sphingolipid C(9)-methyltransferase n=1 Tax=Basidiobolus meristosporus CBS 931.73 TaxID=1314790 RepID=A0A1Y1X3J0_9FUNG|nr:S-adenosyl-L-methionine-dependent methyltransferase [Basidiobolus meristosporus CBS 931.73]|eukprot:ORX80379.1 S-adenosyl-L-methionine-dependent methyltransferase [Basidiobolus meristosporus CBS 931.73]